MQPAARISGAHPGLAAQPQPASRAANGSRGLLPALDPSSRARANWAAHAPAPCRHEQRGKGEHSARPIWWNAVPRGLPVVHQA